MNRCRAGQAAGSLVSCRVRGHKARRRARFHPQRLPARSGRRLIVAGDHVAVRLANGVRLNGWVTLVHGGIYRVEFEQPLHPAIHEHILCGDGAAPVAPTA